MDAVSGYSFASFAWNALQAAALIVAPQAIIGLLAPYPQSPVAGIPTGGELETYLARSLGFSLLALGFITVVLTGSVPVGSAADTTREDASPYAAPTVLVTTLLHSMSTLYSWAWYSSTGRSGFFLGCMGSAALAASGIWCLLFGGEKARISRRTGADKRTSGFPFKNSEADRRKAR
ncbi:hypothetical protein F4808DRAFT_456497 [Astrocystis sublimbata]|nr:hypothetical protein F4808DRAFT_456497 [Astrocystis sublimbata]